MGQVSFLNSLGLIYLIFLSEIVESYLRKRGSCFVIIKHRLDPSDPTLVPLQNTLSKIYTARVREIFFM